MNDMIKTRALRWSLCGVMLTTSFALGCGRDDSNKAVAKDPNVIVAPADVAPTLVNASNSPRLELLLPDEQSPALKLAADDLAELYRNLLGSPNGEQALRVSAGGVAESERDVLIWVDILAEDDAEIPEQGYRITPFGTQGGKQGLHIQAEDDIAAMYALYALADLHGARYHHPEETFLPGQNPGATLPWMSDFSGEVDSPRFPLRGFHEHTQHPTPMSDFYLRPDDGEEFRPFVSRYMKWLARNRQNVASWQMLKSVDLDAWDPYISDIIKEAHDYGIKVGMVTSFSDEQQNNFKIVLPDRTTSEGVVMTEEEQIRDVITRFDGMGFDFYTFQIGSSEFTKPGDKLTVDRLNYAAEVSKSLDSGPELFTWIHMICSLEDDQGGYFYHLAGEADGSVGTWVHTVMFHDLEHPAPVYDCENFHHQRDFLKQELPERPQVYFPETAWWLGFDNNMPLVLPITGWTRSWDIKEELKGLDMRGHITFTTGREWTYWQYDHFLTKSTWDESFDWPAYLEWVSQMYGDQGDEVALVLDEWALLQKKHFFDENPEIYFYLSGELTQDEIGAKAGILARRPKIAYQEVVGYDEETFNTWKTRDLDMLIRMKGEFEEVLARFPEPPTPSSKSDALQVKLAYEVWAGLHLYVLRIEHAIELYTGVKDVREWTRLYQSGTAYDDPRRETLRMAAMQHLDAAKSLSAKAQAVILKVSSTTYRYSAELLTQPKPESPTSYPIGYLQETEEAYFWTRRDVQLDQLIENNFAEDLETWVDEPAPIYYAKGNRITLTEPDSPVAGSIIASFIPQMLLGINGNFEPGSAEAKLILGQDYNENFKPDEGTERAFSITDITEQGGMAVGEDYTLNVRDATGEPVGAGQLILMSPSLEIEVERDATGLPILQEAFISGQVSSMALTELVKSVDGIDTEGVENLIKGVFNLPLEEDLPENLDVTFRFRVQVKDAE